MTVSGRGFCPCSSSTPLESKSTELFASVLVVFKACEAFGLVNRMPGRVSIPSAIFDTFKKSTRCCTGKSSSYFGLHSGMVLLWEVYCKYFWIFCQVCLLLRHPSSPEKKDEGFPLDIFTVAFLGRGHSSLLRKQSHCWQKYGILNAYRKGIS